MNLSESRDTAHAVVGTVDLSPGLAGSEALFRAAFEQAIVGMALRALGAAEPRWLLVNQRLCEMLGYTQEEFLKMPPVEINPPEEREAAAVRTRMLELGEIGDYTREKRYQHKNGSIVHVTVSRSLLRDTEGRPAYIFSVVRDITYRVRAEQERSRLAAIVDQSNDAIVSRMADGTVLTWNKAAERMFGYTAEEMIGQPVTRIVPPDRLHEFRIFPKGTSVSEAPRRYESVRLTSDGRLIDVAISASRILSADGSVDSVALIFNDITQRKRADAHMRVVAGVFAHAAEGIVIADKAHNIILVNPAFSRMTGYEAGDVVGNPVRTLAAGWRTPELHDEVWNVVAQTGAWEGEIWDWRKNREPYCVYLSVSVIPDGEGRASQYCMLFMDITDHKIAEGKLLQLNAELEKRVAQRTADLQHVNRELEAFSFSVSHDLRAPLRAVRGFSRLLRNALAKGELDGSATAYAENIEDGISRMENLIRDLLDLSRLSRQNLNRKVVDVSAMAEAELSSLLESRPERRVEYSVMPGMTMNADPGLIGIVLQNLIGNAWKFSACTTPARIEVGCERGSGEDVFFVRDNGAGFDMRYAAKLFVPFQRLHGRGEFEGSGIGLSIVQRIVSRHGGRVWAQAKPGEGATFFFTVGALADFVSKQ